MSKRRFQTVEQVIVALKQAAESCQDDLDAIRKKYRRFGVSVPYQELSYRTFAGPFKVRDGMFRTDRFEFNPISLEATSYGWWSMLAVHKGKLIRNTCGYSMQTSVHQTMLDRALEALKIEPDFTVCTKANIGNLNAWKGHLLAQYAEAVVCLNHGRNKQRLGKYVKYVQQQMRQTASIGMKFSQAEKIKAVKAAEEARTKRLESKRMIKAIRAEREQARVAVNAPMPMQQPMVEVTKLRLAKP